MAGACGKGLRGDAGGDKEYRGLVAVDLGSVESLRSVDCKATYLSVNKFVIVVTSKPHILHFSGWRYLLFFGSLR